MVSPWSKDMRFRLFEDEEADAGRTPGPSLSAGPPLSPDAEAPLPGRVNCRNCSASYESGNPVEAKSHTEPVNCGQSCRCVGRPRCYMCHGSFCCCVEH